MSSFFVTETLFFYFTNRQPLIDFIALKGFSRLIMCVNLSSLFYQKNDHHRSKNFQIRKLESNVFARQIWSTTWWNFRVTSSIINEWVIHMKKMFIYICFMTCRKGLFWLFFLSLHRFLTLTHISCMQIKNSIKYIEGEVSSQFLSALQQFSCFQDVVRKKKMVQQL